MHEQGERKERKHLVAVSPFPLCRRKEKNRRERGEKFSPLYNVRKQNPRGKQRKGSSSYSLFPTLFFSSFFCGLNSWSVFGWDVSYPPFPPGSDSKERETRRKRKHFFCGGRGKWFVVSFPSLFPARSANTLSSMPPRPRGVLTAALLAV